MHLRNKNEPKRKKKILFIYSFVHLFIMLFKWHNVQVAIHNPLDGIMHANLGQLQTIKTVQ